MYLTKTIPLTLLNRILFNGLSFVLGIVVCSSYLHVYGPKLVETEQHSMCFDTDQYEAWVAHKEGELRCFMEWRAFPHKVKASNLD